MPPDADTLSIFDAAPDERASGKLDVVRAEFAEAQTLSWEELFAGYTELFAITYSSGMDFICALLKKFEKAEIIFGFDEVISYSLQEIMAYQLKTVERLRERASKNKLDLIARIDDGSLRLLVARKQLSHEKIYILRAEDGRKRVIMGSANMSHAAFSGSQRENICYFDGERAFDWYHDCFAYLRAQSADDITRESLLLADDAENVEAIPVAQTVKIQKALVIEPQIDARDDIRFIMDVRNLAKKFSGFLPAPDKKGKILLAPETLKLTRHRLEDANIQEKELRSEYPQLRVDLENQCVTLNGAPLDLCPDVNETARDIALFMDYMRGYEKFHGDVAMMQNRYYEFANWFFVTPFLAQLRNMAVFYNQNLLPYPVFGLIYGQSKAGKTSFLETLLKMMIGQKTKVAAPDFTRTSIEGLKRTVEGSPIIVDDLTQNRFAQHAIETIKNDTFGVEERLLYYPAVVISANEDVKAVAPEVIRRTVICRVQAGLTNTELMKTNVVRRVQRNIGTAFFREYTRRMMDAIPAMLEELKSDDDAAAPDVLAVSSEIMSAIIHEHMSEPPSFVRALTLEDYFSEKVTGSHAIKTIRSAWKINNKAFVVDKKFGQLRYNSGQVWEADRILKELPEDLEALKSREWIIMDLDKAREFFGINFRKNRFFGG
ncbi:MAG: NgoFVII family restriction endonuclease [Spirochaetota bacterium]|jgi:hypothetical protein|nr:NgoFVII family restriction endonuclease [Spirochaetota bacterium]